MRRAAAERVERTGTIGLASMTGMFGRTGMLTYIEPDAHPSSGTAVASLGPNGTNPVGARLEDLEGRPFHTF